MSETTEDGRPVTEWNSLRKSSQQQQCVSVSEEEPLVVGLDFQQVLGFRFSRGVCACGVIDCDCGQLRVGGALVFVERSGLGIAPGVGGETGPLKLWPTDRKVERGVLRLESVLKKVGEAGKEKKDETATDGPGRCIVTERNGHPPAVVRELSHQPC